LHLNNDQIDLLLRTASDGKEDETVDRIDLENAKAHLETCESCKSSVQAQRQAMERLAHLKHNSPGEASPVCPPDRVWIELAAGSLIGASEQYMTHAAQCDHCGPQLLEATRIMAVEYTGEEEAFVRALQSSTPEWQQSLAWRFGENNSLRDLKHLHESTVATTISTQSRIPVTQYLKKWFLPVALLGACAIFLTSVMIRFKWPSNNVRSDPAEQLILQAYAERRTVETRIDNAPYSLFHQERGSGLAFNRMDRPALLRAEAEIAQHLKSDPENAQWLEASGRASLLEGDPDTAIRDFQRAQNLDAKSLSIQVDLASAYILAGELDGDGLQFGIADQILHTVLKNDPRNEVAEFNDALALEKLPIKNPPIAAWKQFLSDHPKSDWAPEARQHLDRLEGEAHGQSLRSNEPLLSLHLVAGAFQEKNQAAISVIDARIEEYADEGSQRWLPRFEDSRGANGELKEALEGLAVLLSERHGDRWLEDMLSSANLRSAEFREATYKLAEGERAIQASDDQTGRDDLATAEALFTITKTQSGILRTGFDLSFIDQLERRRRSCQERASQMLKNEAIQAYSWLEIQAKLELAACVPDNDPRAEKEVLAAEAIARQRRFRLLFLRALSFEAGICKARGDWKRAWAISSEGLDRFWAGDYPPARGYNFLFNLQEVADDRHESFLQASMLEEAVDIMVSHPNVGARAFAEDHLGQALLESGDLERAKTAFLSAQNLFKDVPSGDRKIELVTESELGLAGVELEKGQAQDADRRLESIRKKVEHIADSDLQRVFFESVGKAELSLGLFDSANADLSLALQQVKKERGLAISNSDQWKWSHANENVNRAMVKLLLLVNPAQAWLQWEDYKGEASGVPRNLSLEANARNSVYLRASTFLTSTSSRKNANSSPVLISYFIDSKAIAVWILNGKDIKQLWIPIQTADLDAKIKRLLEYCSNPDSNMMILRGDASALYRLLVLPLEPWLDGRTQVILEPDGALRSIPWEVLIDSQGRYLGDRVSIAVSPGIAYLDRARKWDGIGPDSRALVMGDPRAQGWPPLEAAEDEARSVAGLFRESKLLLGESVTRDRIKSDIPQSNVIHFSGHASTTNGSTGLVIRDNQVLGRWPVASSAAGLNQLVVLSACTTARGTSGYFDDEDSLVREIMSARVPDIVASRWMVDSTATQRLMRIFYESLFSGRSVSASLTIAERNLRMSSNYEHPFYWAAFAVFGRG
jgi:CHAT domain-containing protein